MMASFPISLLIGSEIISIGEFTYDDTVLKVKQRYCDGYNNSTYVNVNKIILIHLSKTNNDYKTMNNSKTLGYYDDNVDSVMFIGLMFNERGG
mmetsp:Transcript_81616/g.100068  ORF Transcript_81616/g.100068 Transcript_81616/m.100068 type:complete len:93 (+) Transcript_81616:42-320(+)